MIVLASLPNDVEMLLRDCNADAELRGAGRVARALSASPRQQQSLVRLPVAVMRGLAPIVGAIDQ